jgi:hypothetical protein
MTIADPKSAAGRGAGTLDRPARCALDKGLQAASGPAGASAEA